MNNEYHTDELLRRALGDVEGPGDALLRQVKASLRKEQDMKTTKTTKRVMTLALAAALVLALGVTAYAALDGAEWFKNWFADLKNGTLTEGQQAYIDSAVTEPGGSASANGWTMTAASALTDGHRAYIALDVTAPEDVDLSAGALVSWPSLRSTDPDAENVSLGYGGMVWTDDGDGLANTAKLLINAELLEPNFDVPWALTIPDYKVYDGEKGYEVILGEGPWTLELTLDPAARSMELGGVPFDCTTTLIGSQDGQSTETLDITIDSVCLYPTCAVMTFAYEGQKQNALPAFDLLMALAGGAADRIDDYSCQWDEAQTENVVTFQFAAPIDLDEVTAVTLQGHDLTLPD